jgi:hypothetical protein
MNRIPTLMVFSTQALSSVTISLWWDGCVENYSKKISFETNNRSNNYSKKCNETINKIFSTRENESYSCFQFWLY